MVVLRDKIVLNKDILKSELLNNNDDENEDLSSINPEALCLSDFKWLLSSLAIIASFYTAIGYQNQAEMVYNHYIKLVEDLYSVESAEASNGYFMLGGFYFEEE